MADDQNNRPNKGGQSEDFIKSDVKPERYEKPEERPKPSPTPPSPKKD